MNNPIIRRLLLGRFLSTLADQFLLFAIPLIIYKATGSVTLSGLAFAIEWLPRIISLPIAGVLSDRLGARKVFLVADSVRAVACAMGFVLILLVPGNAIFITLSVLAGVIAFFYAQGFIALEASLPRMLKITDLPKAQSVFQGIEQLSSVGGPLLASLWVLFGSAESLLMVSSVMFAVSFASNFGIPISNTEETSKKVNLVDNIRLAIKHVTTLPGLSVLIGYTILVNIMYGLALALAAPISKGVFKVSDQHFGVLYSVSGVTTLLFLAAVPWILKCMSLPKLGIIAFVALVIGSLSNGVTMNFWVFVIGFGTIFGADALFNVYIRTERAKLIPKEDMGKTIGVIVCLNQLSMPISGLLVTRFGASLGEQNLIVIMTVISTTLAGLLWVSTQLQRKSSYEVTGTAQNSLS